MGKYYAVAQGRKPGIYTDWNECKAQVDGFAGNKFKSFNSLKEAEEFMTENSKSKKAAVKPITKISKLIIPERSKLNTEQLKALDLMHSGKNIFITGDAGTGKSFLLNTFLGESLCSGSNIVVCAPTGIAAININGSTIHKAFNIKVSDGLIGPDKKPNSKNIKILKYADILIIDEISMCRFDIFSFVVKCLNKVKKEYKKDIQLIVVGDFAQLPPVITNSDRPVLQEAWKDVIKDIGSGFAFICPEWKEMHFENVVLKTVVRQNDEKFVKALTRLKKGLPSSINFFNKNVSKFEASKHINAIHLCGTNSAAKLINDKKIAELKGIKKKYISHITGIVTQGEKATDDILELGIGARVMSLVNSNNQYQNGSLGTIVEMNKNSVVVSFDNGAICTIGLYEWEIIKYKIKNGKIEKEVVGVFKQLPLKIAYAITIHKSQGQTYDSVIVEPDCFAHGQLYVALSRATKLENMYLTDNINVDSLIIDKDTQSFLKKIDKTSK